MEQIYDVIVVGGGMAGVSAAVSAARLGCRTLLIEKNAMLGGLGTSGLMTMVMASRRWFSGLGKTLIDSLIAQGDARIIDDYPVKDYQRIPFDGEAMKRALDSLLLSSGAELLLYSHITGIEKENGKITVLRVNGGEGDFRVKAKLFIDATGDGQLAYYAGEDYDIGDDSGNVQAPTMTAYYCGIDFDRYEAFLKTYEGKGDGIPKVNMIRELAPKAVADGVLSVCDLHHPGIFRISPCFNVGVMNAGHIYGAECISPKGLTEATIAGRKMAKEYLDFYRRYVPGFEHAYMTNTCSTLGLRETRRIRGRYITTFEDKASYRKFEDAVMRFDGGAVSDVHASSAAREAYDAYYKLFTAREGLREDDWAELPYRSLLADRTENLLLAGRCVSADRKTQGQLRIMGYCFMMGQASGTAAAVSVRSGELPGEIDMHTLQYQLEKDGMEI